MTSLIVANFLGAALYAVLAAAGLQFVGLGNVNSQSWGTMLYWAQNNEALQSGSPLWAIDARGLHRHAGRGVRPAELRLRRDQQPGPATGRGGAWATPQFLRCATSRRLRDGQRARRAPSTG